MASPCPAAYGGVQNKDLYVYQGDNFAIIIELYQTDGTPAELSGYTPLAQVRTAVADATAVVAATFDTSFISGYQISMSLPKATTALLAGRYVWDLEVTSPTDFTTTIAAGAVIALQEVSRP